MTKLALFSEQPNIYSWKYTITIRWLLLTVIANMYVKHFKEIIIRTALLDQTIELRSLDGSITFWPHQEDVQIMLDNQSFHGV